MKNWLLRLKYRLLAMHDCRERLNRTSDVEDELLKMARGLLPLPDKAKCRDLAQRLGVPDAFRGK